MLMPIPSSCCMVQLRGIYSLTEAWTSKLTVCYNGLFSAVLVDFEMIKDLILNQTVTANMVLLVTGGLPYSGKSTLINKLVNASGR